MIAIIVYQRLVAAIEFHDILHGFQVKQGMGTATLEAKLLHQISGMRQEVMYKIFFDIHKSYNVTERGRTLIILEGYVVGTRMRRLFVVHWGRAVMKSRESGFYRDPFQ